MSLDIACLIIGDEEAASQTVKLKWMASKEQNAIAQAELLAMTNELQQQLSSFKTTV